MFYIIRWNQAMHYLTVDHLDHATYHTRKKHKVFWFFREVKVLIIFGVIAFVGVTVFTNAQLFLASIENIFWSTKSVSVEAIKQNMTQNNSISSIIDYQQQKEQEIDELAQKYISKNWKIAIPLAQDMEEFLAEQVKGYDFTFNTLPPTNRLIVPRFNVDDPIVISKYTNMKEFIYKNYNEELKEWVVKYPTTPEPGQPGNTLIFGHTSQERWKENPYGMAFAHIAQIDKGDILQVVWEGQLYEYKVVDIQVKYPQHVNEAYMEYANTPKNYLTLMGCYPIGTAKQRILVIAEQLTEE